MPIAAAVQEGSEVRVYDADGQKLFSKAGNLYCYSCTVVAVCGNKGYNPNGLYVYDDTGYTICLRNMPGVTAEQLLDEYRNVIGGEAKRKELERLRERAKHNEASALAHARREERLEMAKMLRDDGVDVNILSKRTGLSVHDIAKL